MPHLRLVRAALAAAVAIAAPPLVAMPAGATGIAFDVSLSTNAVAVSGTDTVPVTLTAHIASGCSAPIARATFAGPRWTSAFADLTLTSGTPIDGVWSATVPVSAAWDGTWRLVDITRYGASCQSPDPDFWTPPAADPAYTIAVTGTNRPVFTYTLTPSPAPYNATSTSVRGHLALQDGTPIAGANVWTSAESEFCGNVNPIGVPVPVTDASGDVTVPVRIGVGVSCVTIVGWPAAPDTYFAYAVFTARQAVLLTASVNVRSVRIGRSIDVTGSLSYAWPCAFSGQAGLHLQRYAAGHWHNVPATLSCRRDPRTQHPGLYSFHTRTRVRGNVRYRTYYPGGISNLGLYAPGISKTLIVAVH